MHFFSRLLQTLLYGLRKFRLYLYTYRRVFIRTLSACALVVVMLYAVFIQPPHNFPIKETITIPAGSSLHDVADTLKEQDVVRSSLWYKVFNKLSGNQSKIQAGDYYFHVPENLFEVTARIVTGDFGLTPIVVRVPEGATIFSIGELMENYFDKFDKEAFIARALKDESEGYLFPDTYQFLPNASEEKIYDTLRETFHERIATVTPQIEEFGKPLEEVIIMASIIEKESAHDFEERRTISGILWNRIDIGMALQVDAVFPYINGKNTYQLSTDDLQIDSPYNTYKYPGLPIGPIANPSLDSIIAAVTPIQTNYLFYLHDMEGNVHYSTNFEQHKQNKFKYLR